MKVKDTFILRNVAGSNIVVPIGSDMIEFNGMITLNETGAFLWNILKEDKTFEELLDALISEYDIGKEIAKKDIQEFLSSLNKAGIIEE